MARRLAPARTRSAISTRSSSDKNLADKHVVLVIAMGGYCSSAPDLNVTVRP